MPDFQRIRYICDKTSHISVTFLDKFLLYLCAAEEGLDKRFAQMLTKYWHIIQKMPENWVLWLTSQYIAFQLFRRGGLAHKLLISKRHDRTGICQVDYGSESIRT